MSKKSLVWLSMMVGSTAGGFLPLLWGGDLISLAAVVWSTVGGFAGIWVGNRLGE